MARRNEARHGGHCWKRMPTGVTASLRTPAGVRHILVDDLSCTGVRLRGAGLGCPGEEIHLRLDRLRAFAMVIWSADDRCVIAFDVPLGEADVERIRRATGLARAARPLRRARSRRGRWTRELL